MLISSCGKDKTIDNTWKTIPQEAITISSGDVLLTVNDVEATKGDIKVVAKSADKAEITLNNIVPGYSAVTVVTSLKKEESSVYSFEGSVKLNDGPTFISLKSDMIPYIYEVNVKGTIDLDGKVNAKVTTAISNQFKGGMEGTWSLNRIAPVKDEQVTTGPLWITWSFSDTKYAGATTIAQFGGTILGGALTNYLNDVTFHADGNITAKYWEDEEGGDASTDEGSSITNVLSANMPELDEKGENYVYGNTHEDKWYDSPKANYAFWFVRDGMLYVVPNSALLSDGSDDEQIDLGSLSESLQALSKVGVDVTTLTAEIMKIAQNGFALKYSQEADALKIYVDKSQCDPIINAFIPALPVLDQMLEELSKSEDEDDQQTYQIINMVLGMLGLEKPSDFEAMWKATTDFQIELNLIKNK